MKNILYINLLLISFSCTNSEKNKSQLNDSSIISKNEVLIDSPNSTIARSRDSIPDFLTFKAQEGGFGTLQGVNRTDSAGPYVFWNYYSDSMSFELIFYPKTSPKRDVKYSEIEKANRQNNFKDYVIFSFSYPKPNPDKVADYHADNTPYPVRVKSYVLKNDIWDFISSKEIKNLSELSEYKINIMYSNVR